MELVNKHHNIKERKHQMTTTFYIIAVIGVLVLMGAAYILGWANGRASGRLDGYDEAAGECRRRCAR